jgi:hypothetical protein
MPTVRGRSEVKAFVEALPEKLDGVVRGAARAGAEVIADEIRLRTHSDEVRTNLRIRTKKDDDEIVVKIDIKPGWARSVGIWLEYGTDPHFITVDDSQRDGKSAARINQLGKAGTLVIGGKPVGKTVHHPGARPYPAFRPALDVKAAEAISTAQGYINSRVSRSGIAGSAAPEVERG